MESIRIVFDVKVPDCGKNNLKKLLFLRDRRVVFGYDCLGTRFMVNTMVDNNIYMTRMRRKRNK